MPKKIGILGCGWLGKALAKELMANSYVVFGSVRTKEKANVISRLGITPFIIHIDNQNIIGPIESLLAQSEVLLIAFPPGLRHDKDAQYAARIKLIVNHLEKYTNIRVILLSSIGVFGQSQGTVSEHDTPKPDTEVGNQLLEAEQHLLSLGSRGSIIRLGGLVGDGRHPAKQLSGKKNIPHPNAPTNLVHQQDVVAFIYHIIKQELWGELFHCVSPVHFSRASFYVEQCTLAGISLPEFDQKETTRNKKVIDAKNKKLLGFAYRFPGCSIQDC
jgi:nucleoside-diphosphate-sugar epimerase